MGVLDPEGSGGSGALGEPPPNPVTRIRGFIAPLDMTGPGAGGTGTFGLFGGGLMGPWGFKIFGLAGLAGAGLAGRLRAVFFFGGVVNFPKSGSSYGDGLFV